MSDESDVRVDITLNVTGNPPGKLADAELHFLSGPLAGMCLIGFGVWQKRERPTELSVSMPARQFVAKGEKRSYNLLRISDPNAPPENASRDEKQQYFEPLDRTRRLIMDAYQNTASRPASDGEAPPPEDDIPF
jgi:hypothetical protein